MTTTVIASFSVSDCDHWRAGYAHTVNDPNLLSWQIWRGQDDTNHAFTEETFHTREYAQAVFTSEATHKTRTAGGVDVASLSVNSVDEMV